MGNFQPWSTSSISRLTNNHDGSNKYEQAWEHAGISKVVTRSTPVFEPVFTEDRRLLMFYSIPYRKTTLEVYFKYTSFILWTLEVQKKYALREHPKKYKWSIKTGKNKKVLCLYFNNTLFILFIYAL